MDAIFKFRYLFLLGLVLIFITLPLFNPGYFPHHDDLQVMRIYEMRICFEDLQIPCRWVPDMGYGNGYPLFNYYGVLAYYIGGYLSYLLGFLGAAKALFFIPLVLAGFSLYFLAKELFGEFPGFVAAILYSLAPYRALDTYVRGAIAESFALSLIPLVFYFGLKIAKQGQFKNFLGLSLSLAAFLTSHNIMTLLFMPVFTFWQVFWLWQKKYKFLTQTILSFLLGIGLASFFIIPAFFEKNLVQSESLISLGLDFRAHFVTINQLFFDRSWGYGASVFGSDDTMSFQVGWPHWQLVVILVIILTAFYFKYKNLNLEKSKMLLAFFLILVFLSSLLMMHNKSAIIWEKIPILHFVQFPWRFLSLTIFSASLIGGFFIFVLAGKLRLIIGSIIILITIILNIFFYKPESYYLNLSEEEKLSGSLWDTQKRAGILDYLPKTAYEPKGAAPDDVEVISGDVNLQNFKKNSNSFEFNVEVFKEANLEIPVFDFPNWQVKVNGEKFTHSHQNLLGRIRVDLPPGKYFLEGYFANTLVRTIANTISLISILILLLMMVFKLKRKI